MSLWDEASFASRETPWDVWVLSFPSVNLKVAMSWWRKKKGNVADRVAAGWLVRG